jgi:hypothetical protein
MKHAACKKRIETATIKKAEASKVLGVNPATMWKMMRRGDVPTVQVGDRLYILRKPFMKLFDAGD